jgi:glutaredoxin
MKFIVLAAFLEVAAVLPAQAAQLYRWVDQDGRVVYTDKPPPTNARDTEKMRVNTRADEVPLPYEAKVAVKNFPVTLYVSDCGEPCDAARKLLEARGVPFTEKNGREASVQDELKKLIGAPEVPVLVVGRSPVKGWEPAMWTSALDAAGYPKSIPKRPVPATTATRKDKDKTPAAAPATPAAEAEKSPDKSPEGKPAADASDGKADRLARR